MTRRGFSTSSGNVCSFTIPTSGRSSPLPPLPDPLGANFESSDKTHVEVLKKLRPITRVWVTAASIQAHPVQKKKQISNTFTAEGGRREA